MRKKKFLIPFAIIMLIIALVICGIVVIYRSNLPKENALTFCLRDVDGNSDWDYEFSNNILKVTENTSYYFFHSYSYSRLLKNCTLLLSEPCIYLENIL